MTEGPTANDRGPHSKTDRTTDRLYQHSDKTPSHSSRYFNPQIINGQFLGNALLNEYILF